MSERIYVRVYEKGRKRPSLEFQALTPDEVIREFCWWLARQHPEVFKKIMTRVIKKGGEFRG